MTQSNPCFGGGMRSSGYAAVNESYDHDNLGRGNGSINATV